jgi:hypothetical protein
MGLDRAHDVACQPVERRLVERVGPASTFRAFRAFRARAVPPLQLILRCADCARDLVITGVPAVIPRPFARVHVAAQGQHHLAGVHAVAQMAPCQRAEGRVVAFAGEDQADQISQRVRRLVLPVAHCAGPCGDRRELSQDLGRLVRHPIGYTVQPGHRAFAFLVPEAGDTHDAAKIVDGSIGPEPRCYRLLHLGELVEGQVLDDPVAVPSAGRTLDHNVRLERAGQHRAGVASRRGRRTRRARG